MWDGALPTDKRSRWLPRAKSRATLHSCAQAPSTQGLCLATGQGLCRFSPILLPDAHTHDASGASRTSLDLQRGPPWPLQNILGVGDSHFTGSDPTFAANVGLKQRPPMPSVPCPPGTLAGLLSSSPRKKEGKVPCSEVFPHKMEDARQI